MGYACPVCGDPQADGHHLANHLAFTAMLGDDSHAEWLDERAPDWSGADPADPADLAATVTDHAEETDYPQVFEDTTGGAGGHDDQHGHGHGQTRDHGHVGDPTDALDGVPDDVDPSGSIDDAAERDADDVLAEARELTRRRRANAAGVDGDDETGDDRDDRNDESADASGLTDDG